MLRDRNQRSQGLLKKEQRPTKLAKPAPAASASLVTA
jgi:hypothetical protein